MKPILAVDIGTHAGWAFADQFGTVTSGVWDNSTKPKAPAGERYVKFVEHLRRWHYNTASVNEGKWEIVFEDVKRHLGTQAAHVYGGLLAQLQIFGVDNDVPVIGYPVGTIKKFWTGKGNATKDAMIAEAVRRGFTPADDNEADALALLHLRMSENDHGTIAEDTAAAPKPGHRVRGCRARRASPADTRLGQGLAEPVTSDQDADGGGAAGDCRGDNCPLAEAIRSSGARTAGGGGPGTPLRR